jgi:hypothetical protein
MLCTKCGRVVSVSPKVYAARVEKYDGEENLLKTYVCRTCRGVGAPAGIIKKQLEILGMTEEQLKALQKKEGTVPVKVKKVE